MKRKPPARSPAKQTVAQRRAFDNLRSKMRDNVARTISHMIGRPGFSDVVELLKEASVLLSPEEQGRLAAALQERIRLIDQQRDNGQILAPEGRAARKPTDDQRADKVCRLYKRIRPQHPPGRTGNGAAVREVTRQVGPVFGRDTPITAKAVRLILKRRGIPCR